MLANKIEDNLLARTSADFSILDSVILYTGTLTLTSDRPMAYNGLGQTVSHRYYLHCSRPARGEYKLNTVCVDGSLRFTTVTRIVAIIVSYRLLFVHA